MALRGIWGWVRAIGNLSFVLVRFNALELFWGLSQEKVAKARLTGAIVRGAGPKPPGHKLRKLCN